MHGELVNMVNQIMDNGLHFFVPVLDELDEHNLYNVITR